MAKPDTSAYTTFDQIEGRLDDIIGQVRDKQTSLERSLDLFDEAIALGSKAVSMVDSTAFTPEEEARLAASQDESNNAGSAQETPSIKGASSPQDQEASRASNASASALAEKEVSSAKDQEA